LIHTCKNVFYTGVKLGISLYIEGVQEGAK